MRLTAFLLVLLLAGCAMPPKDSACLGKPITVAGITPLRSVSDAPSDETTFELRFDCGQAMCTIVKDDLGLLMKHNIEFHRRALEAEAKLAAPPKCAETTVTEPSKQAPPRPKQLPPFKGERDL